jgi:predicted DNA-binding antitoxin AbrB/MazE fold protein
MAITVEAVYEDGVLKPAQPLPLRDNAKVRLIVQPVPDQPAPSVEEAEQAVRRTYGLIGWTGDVETLRRIAEDPEFCVLERP